MAGDDFESPSSRPANHSYRPDPARSAVWRVVGLALWSHGAARHARAVPGFLLGAGGLVLALLGQRASAEPVIASAGVTTRLVFTNNLNLTSQAPESGAILQLLPNISAGGRSRRTSWRLYYGPSALFYLGHSELNRVFHVLQADANYQILDEYLSLQVTANANQNLVNPGVQNASFTALGNPDAFGQTASIQIAPVIRLPLLRGDFATVQFSPGINYVFAAQTAGNANNVGSTGSSSSLSIVSGPYFSRWSWTIAGSSNLVSGGDNLASDSGAATGTGEVTATVAYPITPQWQLQALLGYDWGNYGYQFQSPSQSRPDGWRWRLTPVWSPSRSTTIGVGYGRRFGEADYYANVIYKRKKTVLSASYEIVIANARTSILNSNVVNFQDPYGQPIAQPLDNQTLSGSVSNPALRAGYFVQDQLALSVSQQLGRTTAALSLNDYRWTYQDSGNVVEQRQGQLTLNRALSRRARGVFGLEYWVQNQSAAAAGDFDQVVLWTEFSYQVSRRATGSARYSFSQQESSAPGRSFDANSLWLTLNWSM